MRIAVDLQGLQSRESRNRGIGRYVQSLVEGLLERPDALEYVLLANGGLTPPELGGTRSHRIHQVSLGDEDGASTATVLDDLLFKATILGADVDGLFLPSPVELSQATLPDYSGFPGAVYAVCYDLIPFIFAERYLSDAGVRALYTRRLRNIRSADAVFAISESTRQDVIRCLEVPPERVFNVGAGVSPFFCPVPTGDRGIWAERLRAKFGIAGPFVMYTGGEDWRKNIEGLIDAYAALPPALRDGYQVVIACHLTENGDKALRERGQRLGLRSDSLVLTNYVSDEELRALYSLCSLFVFPSYYEGFGLPLVEAMACGSPVITGDNSSLKEIVPAPDQLFDADSTASIAHRLESVLGDEPLRRRLAESAVARAAEFTWDRVADRVHEVLRRTPVSDRRETLTFDRPRSADAEEKESVAFFSPFRPLPSGISDYSEQFLPALSEHYDLDLYTDEGYVPIIETGREHRVYRAVELESTLRRRDYRALIYQMGNSIYHAYIYALLRRHAGISVLHDYNMSGMVYHVGATRPDFGITFPGELEHAYGESQAREIVEAIGSGKYGVGDLPARGIYTNRRIFTRSLGVIVHNEWAYDMAVRERGNDNPFITLIPHMMPAAVEAGMDEMRELRRKHGVPEDSFVFASCGFVAETKRPLPILDAFRAHRVAHPDAYLLFVGGVEMPGVDFDAEIRRRGLEDHIRVTGYVVGLDAFHEWLRLSDVCVTLRYPSNGETSGALLRMLAQGKPSIVTDIGSFASYPDDVVHKLPTPDRGEEVGEITRAFRLMAEDSAYRHRLGGNAADYVRRFHSPERCARLYAEFIERVMRAPETRRRLLADFTGREAARLAPDESDPARLFAPLAALIAAGAV